MFEDLLGECHQNAGKAENGSGFFELQRGCAIIPLPGVDVPFHSRYLRTGVMLFRT